MFSKNGLTLMEIIVVLIIIGIAVCFAFPNFIQPTEQARAAIAQNNLLAIYSAELNYLSNYSNHYCTTSYTPAPEPSCQTEGAGTSCAPDITSINCNLSQSIQDDGTYLYSCQFTAGVPQCTATRKNATSDPQITLSLNTSINLSGAGTANPACVTAHNWCP